MKINTWGIVTKIAMVNFVVICAAIIIWQQKAQSNNLLATSTATADLFIQVSAHNKISDCWMVINGHIYDITNFFGQHPEGDQIMLKYCGKDGSTGFNTKDSLVAKAHSTIAQTLLKQYLIR